ncbi:hypothetical protein GCM10027037_17100 [Mucilaginibacter koreensis]
MDMHDKDFDQLFRSKLEHMEAEPSANAWQNIARQLDGPAAKKSIVPYLRIAATIVVVLTAGTWLMLKGTKTNDQAVDSIKVAARNLPKSTVLEEVKRSDEAQMQSSNPVTEAAQTPATVEPVNHMAAVHRQQQTVNEPAAKQQLVVKPETVLPTENQPVLASVTQPTQPEVTHAVVPDVILAAQPTPKEETVFQTTANQSANTSLASNIATKPKTKRHGIRSLGDVVNLVVSKVDKRDDKLIEFTDTDDDEAVVTGVNLGLFRVKKDK